MTVDVDVVVIGAGFAGLTCAAALVAAGRSVAVLAARDRVGGRTKAGVLAGLTVDLGGMWLGPTQTRLAKLARENGVATYPTPMDGSGVVSLLGRQRSIKGDDFLPAVSAAAIPDLFLTDHKLKKLAASVDPEEPWCHPRAAALDALTLGAWLRANARTRTTRTIFEAVCRSLLCCEPDQVSLLFVLFYIRSGEGLEVLVTAQDGGAQNLLFDGGVYRLAAGMALGLGAAVRLNEPVVAVTQSVDLVEVTTRAGRYTARKVVSTVPPALIDRIQFEPPLPPRKTELVRRQVMGSCIKVWIAYERPFWRDHGRSGFAAIDDMPFNPFWDASPPGQPSGLIAGFFDAAHATEWSGRAADERRATVLATVARALGTGALLPTDYIEHDWTKEQWSRGCYGAFMPPGLLSRYGDELRRPFHHIHWAGTETATSWSGYIEGAIQSGERVCLEVIASRPWHI